MFRFAILKTVQEGKLKVVLEYNEEKLHKRLRRRVQENLSVLGRLVGRKIDNAFYDEKKLLERLQARVKENLIATENFVKHRWNKQEITEAINKAYNELIYEFLESFVADRYNIEEIDKSVGEALEELVHEIRDETVKIV